MNYSNTKSNNIAIPVIFLTPIFAFSYWLYTDAPFLSVVLGAFLVLMLTFFIMSKLRAKDAIIVLCIFIIKFILTAYQAKNKNLPLGGVDWFYFHTIAQEIVDTGSGIVHIFFENNENMFAKFAAFIYSLFGVHTMQINLYVFASSLITSYYVFKTSKLLTDENYYLSVKAMLCFMLWPIDVIFSVTYLREMPTQMLIILSFSFYLEYIKYRRYKKLIIAVIFILIACTMHSGVFGILFVYAVFARLKENDSILKIFSPISIIGVGLIAILVFMTPLWDIISVKLGNIDSAESIVMRTQQFLIEEANTQYITDAPETFDQFLQQIPYRTLLFAFVPLPNMITDMSIAISWLLDALPQVWVVWRLLKLLNMTRKVRTHRLYVIIAEMCILVTYIIFAMGTVAFGNAIRHRAKLLPIIIVFVIAVYDYMKEKIQKNYEKN